MGDVVLYFHICYLYSNILLIVIPVKQVIEPGMRHLGDVHWFIGLFYLDRIYWILQDILFFIFITFQMKVMKNNPPGAERSYNLRKDRKLAGRHSLKPQIHLFKMFIASKYLFYFEFRHYHKRGKICKGYVRLVLVFLE